VSSSARALAALLIVFAGLLALYVVEAFAHHSPWIFFDELDYAQNSRKIADLGTQSGAKPFSFEGFYPLLIAPAWLADSVQGGYSAAKAIGAVAMTTALFPAYWLARSLTVSRPLALFAAAATASVAAMSYSSSLMTETLAYPYATLCFFLIVKALAVRSRAWIAGAVVASILAPVVRKELSVIPAAFAVAAIVLVAGPRLRRRWAAAGLGAVALLAFLAWALTLVSTTWSKGIADPLGMVDYGRKGAGVVVVGAAVLPAIAGLAALVRPRDEPRMPARRAFVAIFGAAATGFLLYTAAKGVYFGASGNPVEERNLIYLYPLLFAGAALWLSRRRVQLPALVAATALAAALVVTVPLHLDPLVPASDALGLEALFSIGWSSAAVHGLLIGIAALSVILILAIPRKSRYVVVGVCALVLCWTLASEVYASRRSADFARVLAAPLPRPFDWITRATAGRPSIYVGQEILQPTDIWLLSFWNPSLVGMRTLDGTPAAPGTHPIGDILPISIARGGVLPTDPRIRFLVADQGITGVGATLAQGERWRVYTPPRLSSAALGVYSDGWTGSQSAYSVFSGARAGEVQVNLSRSAWLGSDVPGHVRVAVDGVVRARAVIHARATVGRTVPTPPPPFRVAVTIEPTFSPHALDPAYPDTRRLGAQVSYRFIPAPFR
jgi:hypothetical protein